MKKVLYLLFAAGMFTFVSCDSPQENKAEEAEDAAEQTADDMEDAADDIEDTTAVVQ